MLHDELRSRLPRPLRSKARAALAGSVAVATVLGLAATQAHAASAPANGPVGGSGFDTCNTPPIEAIHAWAQSSPHQAVGVYIGGVNRSCPDGNLTPAWVQQVHALDFSVLPIYVGLQSPTVTAHNATIDPGGAHAQGMAAADDAVGRAKAFGMGPGTVLFLDMENYARGGEGTQATMDFISSWNYELHQQGYPSGVYASLNSGIVDLINSPTARPDEIWSAHWDGVGSVADPAIPSNLWANHQRIKQFAGDHDESYGGVTLSVDTDTVDATLVQTPAASATPAPPPPPTDTPPIVLPAKRR